MAKIETAAQLAQACVDVATGYDTVYVLGCCGAPLTERNKNRYMDAHAFNRQLSRKKAVQDCNKDDFGFDCVCLIKSLLWGWNGDSDKTYGGAVYLANGVPDIGADEMLKVCKDVSADFSDIQPGELLWCKGHVGIYVGDGLAVECTYRWNDGVQITAVHNIRKIAGMNGRSWTKHGKLPWVTYENVSNSDTTEPDYTLGMRILREGCTGEDVRALQILLKANGYDLGASGPKRDGIDGDFGKKTGDAVEAYQGKESLTQDRVAGIDTMSHLMGIK